MGDEDESSSRFESLLDEALDSYVNVELPPSLAERIMIRAQERPPRRYSLWWLTAAAGCAAALIVALLLSPSRMKTMPPEMANASPARGLIEPAAVPMAGPDHPAARKRVAARKRIRRGYQPAPLSEQERLLLQFAMEHPEQARQVLAPPPSGPVRIAPITIAPIEIADIHAPHDSAFAMDTQ